MKSSKTKETRASTERRLLPTLGPLVCAWIEANLVYGPGDVAGQRIRLRKWQKRIIYRCYELTEDGKRRWRRVILFLPRGSAKTELLAMIAAVELAGPAMFDGWNDDGTPRAKLRTSPDVPLAAGSYEQADLAFGALTAMIRGGPLAEFLYCWDSEVVFKDGRPGRAYRIVAKASASEGLRPTFAGKDEIHEWIGPKKRLSTVIEFGLSKRTAGGGGWSLDITTAGAIGQDSVAEDAYAQWKVQCEQGEDASDVLVINYAASEHWNLDDPAQLRAAIREANPAADDWIDVETVAKLWRAPGTPTHEFRRYRLNQWVDLTLEESWLHSHPGAWASCFSDLDLVPGQDIAAGVDWALRHDRAAVVWTGFGVDDEGNTRRIVRSRTFTAPPNGKLDAGDAMALLRTLSLTYNLRAVEYDPRFFEFPAATLLDEGIPMVEVPQSADRMIPRCGFAFSAVTGGEVAHDGDATLTAHVANAVKREGIDRGWTLSKSKSLRPIDACIALVLALYAAEEIAMQPKFDPVQVF